MDRLLDWFLGYLTKQYQLMVFFRFSVEDKKIRSWAEKKVQRSSRKELSMLMSWRHRVIGTGLILVTKVEGTVKLHAPAALPHRKYSQITFDKDVDGSRNWPQETCSAEHDTISVYSKWWHTSILHVLVYATTKDFYAKSLKWYTEICRICVVLACH